MPAAPSAGAVYLVAYVNTRTPRGLSVEKVEGLPPETLTMQQGDTSPSASAISRISAWCRSGGASLSIPVRSGTSTSTPSGGVPR